MTDENDIKEMDISLYSLDKENIFDKQPCFIPVHLMQEAKIKPNSFCILKFNKKKIICQVSPTSSYQMSNFEGLFSCNVSENMSLSDICSLKKLKISLDDLTFAPTLEIHTVMAHFIMNSTECVTNYEKYKSYLINEYKTLFMLYRFGQNSTINCSKNPLAKLLGISFIIIKDIIFNQTNLNENYIGKVSLSTTVLIEKVESIDKIQSSVNDRIILGGLEYITAKLSHIVLDPWNMKDNFSNLNLSYPRGILLIGPPGCGKTSLVKSLSAETGSSCIITSSVQLKGDNENEIHQKFLRVLQRACQLSKEGPCILFIDEIDSLCPTRTEESDINAIRLTTQICLSLDQCKGFPYLVVIAATNRPFALDPAVRRSGRLELEILLNVPTEEERKAILSVHSEGLLPTDHSGLFRLSHCTPGFVGADLQYLCEKMKKIISEENSLDFNEEDIIIKMEEIARTIVPSIHKTSSFITSKPVLTPVGGLQDVKRELMKIFFHHKKYSLLYKKFKIKKPKGVLLYGPRGCGKTRLVSELASMQGYNFISANASHLLSPFVGDSEKKVAALFHSARVSQPSIVFIDEIDGIFGSRNEEKSSTVRASLLTELLQALDGADVNVTSLQGSSFINNTVVDAVENNILICAATNHPHLLDSALIRPGRFDKLVYVPPPDVEARLQILKLKFSKLKFEDSDILKRIAEETNGWTGAELENFTSKVALESILRNPEAIKCVIKTEVLLTNLKRFTPHLTEKELKFYENFRNSVFL